MAFCELTITDDLATASWWQSDLSIVVDTVDQGEIATMANHWWQIWVFNPYGNFNVKRQGRIDGKLSIPPWTSEQQPDFLRELYHLTQTTLETLVETWHKIDRRLKGDWVDATLHQQQAEKEFVEAMEREEQAQQRHEETHGRRLAVPDSPRGRTFFYWLIVAFVLVCEFPFNGIIFQQLGVSEYATWLMAGTIAMGLVACAHFLGAQMHLPTKGAMTIIHRILLATLPFIAIVCVAMLRRDHMRQQALSNLDPAELLATNLIINVLIFWALTYYSYKLHDPVVEAVLKALQQRQDKEQHAHLAEKATASTRINRQKEHQQALQNATGWVSEVRRRAALYRRTHLRVRPDRDQVGTPVPEWFNREPDLTIPEVLKQLEWNMDPTSSAVEQTVPTMRFSATTTR